MSGIVVAVISVGFSAAGAWRALELQSYNFLHQTQRELSGTPSWNEQIIVIAIDDASVEQLGHFPWPRQSYADLLDQLSGAQPAAVAFNILLPEATPQDEPLAQSIVGSANVVLAVGSGHQDKYVDVAPTIANLAEGFFLRGDNGTHTDEDGVSRQMHLQGEEGFPSLGVATLQVYADNLLNTTSATSVPNHRRPHRSVFDRAPTSVVDSQPTSLISNQWVESIQPEALIQDLLPSSGPVWIRWPGEVSYPSIAKSPDQLSQQSPGALQVYSYADVVNGLVDTSHFQNKIVLVGTTLTGVDTLRTPFQTAEPTSGVYVYAATISNLLDQSFLRRPTQQQSLLLLCLLAMISTHLLRKQDVFQRLAVVAGFPILWTALAYVGFVMGWWLPIAAPVVTIVISALAVQIQEQQEKQQLMALLSMNVSAGTAALIWRHKGQILDRGELSAQNLTATVLFMDIRGFTGIAETLSGQQLLPWLNQYFETMTDCIMEHGGMVDKYIGDAIMAVFGAPIPRTGHDEIRADAIAALQAAVEMHGRLNRLNHQLTAQNLPTIKFGIGIHTGPLVGGTVGNRHRLNYSLFGDTVNVAARLESMTKSLPTAAPFSVLVSERTYQHTKDHFPLELFRRAKLAGRKETTAAYSMVPQPEPSVDELNANEISLDEAITNKPQGRLSFG